MNRHRTPKQREPDRFVIGLVVLAFGLALWIWLLTK